jgi:hypothetical protein
MIVTFDLATSFKKIIAFSGVLFNTIKATVNQPSSPRIPPQANHKNTTLGPGFSQNTPQKPNKQALPAP